MTHVIKVRVDDVAAQFERARAAGARALEPLPPTTFTANENAPSRISPAIAGNSAKHCGMCSPKSTDARPSRLGRPVRILNFSRLASSNAATPCAR